MNTEQAKSTMLKLQRNGSLRRKQKSEVKLISRQMIPLEFEHQKRMSCIQEGEDDEPKAGGDKQRHIILQEKNSLAHHSFECYKKLFEIISNERGVDEIEITIDLKSEETSIRAESSQPYRTQSEGVEVSASGENKENVVGSSTASTAADSKAAISTKVLPPLQDSKSCTPVRPFTSLLNTPKKRASLRPLTTTPSSESLFKTPTASNQEKRESIAANLFETPNTRQALAPLCAQPQVPRKKEQLRYFKHDFKKENLYNNFFEDSEDEEQQPARTIAEEELESLQEQHLATEGDAYAHSPRETLNTECDETLLRLNTEATDVTLQNAHLYCVRGNEYLEEEKEEQQQRIKTEQESYLELHISNEQRLQTETETLGDCLPSPLTKCCEGEESIFHRYEKLYTTKKPEECGEQQSEPVLPALKNLFENERIIESAANTHRRLKTEGSECLVGKLVPSRTELPERNPSLKLSKARCDTMTAAKFLEKVRKHCLKNSPSKYNVKIFDKYLFILD